MTQRAKWLFDLQSTDVTTGVDGLVGVADYSATGRPPEEVIAIEKARQYGATAVFFEAGRNGAPPIAQAFIFVSNGPVSDPSFADTHRRLWSWGGVPLAYRVTSGVVQLFRCAHKAEFESDGKVVFRPFKTLNAATLIANDPWWDAERLRNGTIWDDPNTCKKLLSGTHASHKLLIAEVQQLYADLNDKGVLPKHLRRKLLILSLLIAYLEERKVFEDDYFEQFLSGATRFFQVLANGAALVALLDHLEQRFNGHVFVLAEEDKERLRSSGQLSTFARLVEGRQERSGQLSLWQRYSFADLPIELISHIYQLFVTDSATSVYTPPFLVRTMLSEVLSWERLDKLAETNEVILDPACGSGVFLVEAYKRLILHWRSRNNWKAPSKAVLQRLLAHVHGCDIEQGAVELATFSLCLALCDALEPAHIRSSIRLFPVLQQKSIYHSCFFGALERKWFRGKVGIVVGNPPFTSTLKTPGAQAAYDRYQMAYGTLPDKQLAYLFLHESMSLVNEGGVLCMLQQYNLLYNKQSLGFRRAFFQQWEVREVLDFISVRGLFSKGDADTKVVVIVAEAKAPAPDRQILHATFRRTGRVQAERGFDIDYYDMHWLPRSVAMNNDGVWRSNLLGGGRILALVDRLKSLRTLGQFAEEEGWDFGEGFIEGQKGVNRPADHIVGKPLLPSEALTKDGIDLKSISIAQRKPIEGPRSEARFTPPMLLVREQMDLPSAVWVDRYLTYKNKIVGLCAPKTATNKLRKVKEWLDSEDTLLQAYVAAISIRLFTQKSTTLSSADILALPYPPELSLDASEHERIVAEDVVHYYRDLVRLGDQAEAMRVPTHKSVEEFNDVFVTQINAVYKRTKLRALPPQRWPGFLCQPYIFGSGEVDWSGTDELRVRLASLIRDERGAGLQVTRIAKIYDGASIYLLKPDRLRYWLRSVALRDADETLADLWGQGF
jgi:hypothetical protein